MKYVTIVLFFLVSLTSPATAQDKLTASEIINKHLAAVGGKEALAK